MNVKNFMMYFSYVSIIMTLTIPILINGFFQKDISQGTECRSKCGKCRSRCGQCR